MHVFVYECVCEIIYMDEFVQITMTLWRYNYNIGITSYFKIIIIINIFISRFGIESCQMVPTRSHL